MIGNRTIRTTSRQNYNLKLNVPDVLILWSYVLASIVCTISVSYVTFIFTHKQKKYSDVDGCISNRKKGQCRIVLCLNREVKYLFKLNNEISFGRTRGKSIRIR